MASPSPTKDPQQAFRDFMLQGRGPVPADSPSTRLRTPTSSRTGVPSSPRHHKQIQEAFYKTLQHDWWEIDHVLAQVVASVAELRRRWHVVQKAMQQQQQQQRDDNQNNNNNNNDSSDIWNNYHHHHFYLTSEDLELALCHCVRKHEKTLQNLRSLLSQLSQTQETLGRKLEHILLMTEPTTNVTDNHHRYAIQLYQTAALDLYQKQTWGHELLSSWDPSSGQDEMRAQTKVADKIAAQWSRSHPKSPWQQISSLITQLGEDGNRKDN
eukprot:scaffold689_cov186-Amphora_coffeaeformis.AAC.7